MSRRGARPCDCPSSSFPKCIEHRPSAVWPIPSGGRPFSGVARIGRRRWCRMLGCRRCSNLGRATMTNYAVLGAAFAAAHVVGTRRQHTEGAEKAEIVKGASAQRHVLGQTVYDTAGQAIGKVDDLILTKKTVSYAIVGVGGFL